MVNDERSLGDRSLVSGRTQPKDGPASAADASACYRSELTGGLGRITAIDHMSRVPPPTVGVRCDRLLHQVEH